MYTRAKQRLALTAARIEASRTNTRLVLYYNNKIFVVLVLPVGVSKCSRRNCYHFARRRGRKSNEVRNRSTWTRKMDMGETTGFRRKINAGG